MRLLLWGLLLEILLLAINFDGFYFDVLDLLMMVILSHGHLFRSLHSLGLRDFDINYLLAVFAALLVRVLLFIGVVEVFVDRLSRDGGKRVLSIRIRNVSLIIKSLFPLRALGLPLNYLRLLLRHC